MTSATIHIKTPARVCLFGDHQDYLGLPVIAGAIDRFLNLKAIPIAEKAFHISMPDINEHRIIEFSEISGASTMGDHLMAGLHILSRTAIDFNRGYQIEIRSEIPINAGVSSSSAVMVAWIHFLLKAFSKKQFTSEQIGQWAYEAEVIEQNSPGGKMDQFTIAIGDMLHIDTGKIFNYNILGDHLDGLILGESGQPKQTLGTLGDLRGSALQAIGCVQKVHPNFKIENADENDIERYSSIIPEELGKIYSAAIENYSITNQALKVLNTESVNLSMLGALMTAHHNILKDKLKLTTPLIDLMIDAAIDAGAYGAKIVGSGGGGSIVTIAPDKKMDAVMQAIKDAGAKDAYGIQLCKGTTSI